MSERGFEREFSLFPEKKITLHNFKNVDDEIAPVINQINSLREQGLYGQASRIIENNKDVLKPYIIDAIVANTWDEEIRNTQVYAKQVQQCVFFDEEEPEECQNGDIWIGGSA